MQAFHNDEKNKKKYLDRVTAHERSDEIIKGLYWENGKGCAVGCTIHSSNHKSYETELGIPIWLARLEDRIFEGLPNKIAKEFPRKFLESINTGSDLDKIKIPFLIFVVESTLDKFDHTKYPKTKTAIDNVLIELKKEKINLNKLKETQAATAYAAAADAAAAAAATAYAAAADAADAAAAAAYAAADAAYAAADADAAADAAYAAADAAAYADAAATAVKENQYIIFADKLLELIKECES